MEFLEKKHKTIKSKNTIIDKNRDYDSSHISQHSFDNGHKIEAHNSEIFGKEPSTSRRKTKSN